MCIKPIILVIFPFILWGQKPYSADSSLLLNNNQSITITHYKGVYGFYKKYISTQDGNVCTFGTSCSTFAKDAIHMNGFWLGLLLTADRLCRCNNHNQSFYRHESSMDPLSDPATKY